MKLCFWGLSDALAGGVEALKEQLGFEIAGDGAKISVFSCEKGFRVRAADGACEIYYERPCDFFRALAIAVDALRSGKPVDISEIYTFKTCGVMIDVSRRAVIKPEKIKALMRYMACMGLNRILLYTEDVYELPGYPYFGYMRGGYTKDEIKEMVRYGNLLGIESVPCIQTLAHLERAMRWDAFADVANAADTLLAEEEKTYELIEAMIKAARECCTSDEIHIGMDETYNVNLGKYLDRNGYHDRLAVLCRHMQRTVEIVKKYNFKPMMWGDMFLRRIIADPADKKLAEAIDRIPEGISMVYWSYDGRSEATYSTRFDQMATLRCPTIFSGGIHTWEGPSINYTITFESALSSLRAAKKHGIEHVFAAIWGDQGSICDVFESLLGWQYYAELNYRGVSVGWEELREMFRISTGLDADAFRALDCENYFNRPYPDMSVPMEMNGQPDPVITAAIQVLFQNPLYGLFDKNFEALDLHAHYAALSEKFEKIAVPAGFEKLFAAHAQLLRVLTEKCDIGIRIKTAYDAGDRVALAALASRLDTLACGMRSFCGLRAAVWYENNKPFGFEVLLSNLSAVIGLTENAAVRIRAYLDGEVPSLPELEAERLTYSAKGNLFVMETTPASIMIP